LLWLERFGVAQLAQRRARALSGGEAARVALARAFVTEPALLLLDEPFGALDAPTRAPLLPALRQRLGDTGAAAVLVTHDLGEAFAFGDRLALLDQGRIIATGHAPALMSRPPSRRAAELLAIETILPAHIQTIVGNDLLVILHPDGPVVRVRQGQDHLAAGDDVTFTLPAFAARALRLGACDPTADNLIGGVITAVTPLPSGTRLTVATPAPIVVVAPWDPACGPWMIGDQVVVSFPTDAAHVVSERRHG
jgi:tungstate transport system ATP-binding protein